MNIRTPRFYTDLINYYLTTGTAQDGEFDVTATGGSGVTATRGIQTGTEAELFDMKPLNVVDFDTSGDPDSQVLVTLDLRGSFKKSFVAILNHNLKTAVGKIRIFAGSTATEADDVDGSGASTSDINWATLVDAGEVVEVVNGDTITKATDSKSVIIEPVTDGSTIIRFTEQSLRYWGIQFEGNTTNTGAATNGTWGGTDLFVGCILVGEYYDMPVAPDLSVKRSIIFDKVNVLESYGGQRYSNISSLGRVGSTSKSPFSTSIYQNRTHGGRIVYDMNFSYLASTDVMPTNYDLYEPTDDAVVEDVWNKTCGRHIPFIFSIDNSTGDGEGDNAESQHIFARFGQDSLDMEQVAVDVFNVPMRIEEEF